LKRWLSPWVLPLVMLGVVLMITKPVAGAIWIAVSVIVVRLLNGRFDLPSDDGPALGPYVEDLKRLVLGDPKERRYRTPS
jgi:hypothetical protein